jgi:hypothetical protein
MTSFADLARAAAVIRDLSVLGFSTEDAKIVVVLDKRTFRNAFAGLQALNLYAPLVDPTEDVTEFKCLNVTFVQEKHAPALIG